MYCPKCGNQISKRDRYCPSCGCQIGSKSSEVALDDLKTKSNLQGYSHELANSNIEATGKHIKKPLLVAFSILLSITITGAVFYIIKNDCISEPKRAAQSDNSTGEKLSSDYISEEDFKGTYYACYYDILTNEMEDEDDSSKITLYTDILEVSDDKMKPHYSDDMLMLNESPDSRDGYPYDLEEENGISLLTFGFGPSVDNNWYRVAYYNDLGLVWIRDIANYDGWTSPEFFFSKEKKYVNYLVDLANRCTGQDGEMDEDEWERYLEGKWVDKKNKEDYFIYSKDDDDIIHISSFGEEVKIEEGVDSKYSINNPYDWDELFYTVEKTESTSGGSVERTLQLVPISDNLMVAYYQSCDEKDKECSDCGTIYERN